MSKMNPIRTHYFMHTLLTLGVSDEAVRGNLEKLPWLPTCLNQQEPKPFTINHGPRPTSTIPVRTDKRYRWHHEYCRLLVWQTYNILINIKHSEYLVTQHSRLHRRSYILLGGTMVLHNSFGSLASDVASGASPADIRKVCVCPPAPRKLRTYVFPPQTMPDQHPPTCRWSALIALPPPCQVSARLASLV